MAIADKPFFSLEYLKPQVMPVAHPSSEAGACLTCHPGASVGNEHCNALRAAALCF